MKFTKSISPLILCSLAALCAQPLFAQQAPGRDPADALQSMFRHLSLPDQEPAWLGVELADVTQTKVTELKLPGDYGAIVTHVAENGPAAKAGLTANDVILEFGGMKVWSAAQLKQLVDETPPGRNVGLRVSRNGRRLTLQVTVGQPPEYSFTISPSIKIPRVSIPKGFFYQFPTFGMRGRLGIEAQDLTPQLAGYFAVKQGKGVLVAEVEDGSPAAKAGLKAGDCIVRVDTAEVDSVSGLRRALASKGENDHSIALTIVRGGHEESFRVVLETPWRPNPEQEAENLAGDLGR
jgi:serine protease Do